MSFLSENRYDEPGVQNLLEMIFQESKDWREEVGPDLPWPSPFSFLQPRRNDSLLFLQSLETMLESSQLEPEVEPG
jgi:hypothetical protein